MKYTAIFSLKEKLENADVTFEFNDYTVKGGGYTFRHYQIAYPSYGEDRVCSIIQGDGSYGRNEDLLEIMGLLTTEETKCDTVVGGLTVDDVYNRILNHWNGVKENVK